MISFKKRKSFALKDIEAGHFNVTYKGVPALKSPFDYLLYQLIIFKVKPELIIEIGTRKGGSSLYLADLLELSGGGELHTIDLPSNNEDSMLKNHKRIKTFREGFENYDTSGLHGFRSIMVIDDGSHHYADCLASLKKFSPFVSTGSYFIMEDGIVNELGRASEFEGGPLPAIQNFLEDNKNFEIDRYYCDFFGHNATFNVNGYLKRIS